MGLIKFLKLVNCICFINAIRGHDRLAGYLKVNLPMTVSSDLWSVKIKLSGISGVIGVDSCCRC